MSRALAFPGPIALKATLALAPACRVPDLLERARSPSDANLEPPPTDAAPEGPEAAAGREET